MAAPITHIVLADRVFSTRFRLEDKSGFFVGTSFPDIRYLGVIDRDKTHFKDLKIENLKNLPPFEAGLKFHSLVDEVREKFIRSKQIYSLLPDSPFITQALKFYEDKLLYKKVSNWSDIVSYFDKIRTEEKAYDIEEKNLEKWHGFLRSYFNDVPEDADIQSFVTAIDRPNTMAEEIIKLSREMKKK